MPKPKKTSLGATKPLVTPIYQSSVYTIPDLDALDAIMDGGEPGYIYARDSHPNARLLANLLAKLEAAEWGVVTGAGMGAITAIVLATPQQGQRILAWLHGCQDDGGDGPHARPGDDAPLKH